MRKVVLFVSCCVVLVACVAAARHAQLATATTGARQQQASSITVCPKYVIDYATVVSVPTGCVDATGKSIPCCVDSKGQPYTVNEQLLPDSSSTDATGHVTNHFTMCAGMQVQWHTNVGTCP